MEFPVVASYMQFEIMNDTVILTTWFLSGFIGVLLLILFAGHNFKKVVTVGDLGLMLLGALFGVITFTAGILVGIGWVFETYGDKTLIDFRKKKD